MKSQDLAAIRALSLEELAVQLHEAEDKLFRLKFSHAAMPLKNGVQIRNLRRHRARLKTWIRQRTAASPVQVKA